MHSLHHVPTAVVYTAALFQPRTLPEQGLPSTSHCQPAHHCHPTQTNKGPQQSDSHLVGYNQRIRVLYSSRSSPGSKESHKQRQQGWACLGATCGVSQTLPHCLNHLVKQQQGAAATAPVGCLAGLLPAHLLQLQAVLQCVSLHKLRSRLARRPALLHLHAQHWQPGKVVQLCSTAAAAAAACMASSSGCITVCL